jgi:hypothetical protein
VLLRRNMDLFSPALKPRSGDERPPGDENMALFSDGR